MSEDRNQTQLPVYEIRVIGRLSQERAAWFGNMATHVDCAPDGSVMTVLSGQVPDQAALFGILNRIRDLGLKLLSVNRIEPGVETGNFSNLSREDVR